MWEKKVVGGVVFAPQPIHFLIVNVILLFSPTLQTCGSNAVCVCSRPNPNVELQALSEAAYREYFYEREHYNYYCEDPDIGPCVLSIKREEDDLYDYR